MVLATALATQAQERQLTFSPKNHALDDNDNFSPDNRFLCYDTRDTVAPGIGGCQTIEKVDISTGQETVIYYAKPSDDPQLQTGVGAASFSPVENVVAFIHGPPAETLMTRGSYGTTNRTGATVSADGVGGVSWLDCRDTATDRPTTPGAHRGGTHRHEYARNGKRIGFTYDDAILRTYDRTVGYMEARPEAPEGYSHYFAVLVPIVPKGTARPGEIEKAWADSWVDPKGTMRAFTGMVRQDDGTSYERCLFVVDIPEDVDITTAYSGDPETFPKPPKGTRIRRLTRSFAAGTVRGSPSGDRIAYYARDDEEKIQIYVIPSDGSDNDADLKKRPRQATFLKAGVSSGLRWYPSGKAIACISDGGIAITWVEMGPHFGKTRFLTPHGDGEARSQLVWSSDGRWLAFVKPTPTAGSDGEPLRTVADKDPCQIFILACPDDIKQFVVNELASY